MIQAHSEALMVFFGLMGISSKKWKKFKISKEVRTTANDAATPADDAEAILQAYIKQKTFIKKNSYSRLSVLIKPSENELQAPLSSEHPCLLLLNQVDQSDASYLAFLLSTGLSSSAAALHKRNVKRESMKEQAAKPPPLSLVRRQTWASWFVYRKTK